jgi:pilus assembly protein CpaF
VLLWALTSYRPSTGVAIRTMDELVTRGMLNTHAARFLTAAVRARCSIVFAGAPGSGKTTLLSCATTALDPALRVVTAEEVFELDIPVANLASLQTRAPRADRPAIDLRRLVAGFLRMSPDIAIVGEVRDREALPLLLTLSSGVKGYTTIHAGSARQALTRLRFICQLADVANELPMSALNTLVSESIDLVVHCGRGPDGPFVTEILAVEDLTAGPEATQFTVTELFHTNGPHSGLRPTGEIPQRLTRVMRAAGLDVRALLDEQAP